jgi:hypothetical protein
MRRAHVILSILAAMSTTPFAAAEPARPVEVMVLGSYHFTGGGLDVVNIKVDDVRAPKRQAELARIADALAAFKPTAVVVELETQAPEYADPNFAKFSEAVLKTEVNEREQIGYRLAKRAGIQRVYGIDEQPSTEEPDYFPFGKLAEHASKTGQDAKLGAMVAELQAEAEAFGKSLASRSIADALIETNERASRDASFYFRLSELDRGEAQPGAELQAYWFMRNAKIFSKLMQIAKPGDRIVVLYGSGHKYWLDEFARNTPGYSSVDPVPYLKRADRKH